MIRHKLLAVLVLLPLCVTPLLAASGLSWMKNAPARHFADADWALFSETLDKALNQDTGMDWANPKSGASGSITPVSSGEQNGMTCRKTRIINQAKGQSASSTYTFCQAPDGSWKASAGK